MTDREALELALSVRMLGGSGIVPRRLPPRNLWPQMEAVCRVMDSHTSPCAHLSGGLDLLLILRAAGCNPLVHDQRDQHERWGPLMVTCLHPSWGLALAISDDGMHVAWDARRNINASARAHYRQGDQIRPWNKERDAGTYAWFLSEVRRCAPSLHDLWEAEAAHGAEIETPQVAARASLSELL